MQKRTNAKTRELPNEFGTTMVNAFARSNPVGHSAKDGRPRVLLVVSSLGGGGAERRVSMLRGNLHNVDLETAVFFSREREIQNEMGLHVLGWKGRHSYPAMVVRLRRLIAKNKFDVVMSFGAHPSFVAWFATRIMKPRPIVVLTEITRPFMVNRSAGHWLRKISDRVFKNIVYPRADLFAANSIDGIEESINYYGVKRERAYRLHNMVDEAEFATFGREKGIEATRDQSIFTICTSARLVSMKRIDTLLLAAPRLCQHCGWRMLIIGDGRQRDELERLARKLNIDDRVKFLGWIENPFPIVAASSVYVHCSEWEGFSNGVIEGMFLDVPIITSYCSSDAREMCITGAALGFEPGNAEELRRHIENLISDPTLRDRLRTAARQYRTKYEISSAIQGYDSLIRLAARMRVSGK
jgi:glycosyltransferase involved in cell wall biosynthesis